MKDARTSLERKLWDWFGPPLYYCSECLKSVRVKSNGVGVEPTIKRRCDHDTAQVIAPRRAVCAGKGGMSQAKVATTALQLYSKITGRTP